VIQQRLQNQLANEILSGQHAEGSKIVVDASGGEFTFRNEPVAV
jgi:ATP-dependent Clp protease ATP-binding subunit ClpA